MQGANGIIDSTSNANHGTDINTVGTTTGQIDGSLNFTGAGYVEAPNSTSLNISGTATTVFWANVTDTGGDSVLLEKVWRGPTFTNTPLNSTGMQPKHSTFTFVIRVAPVSSMTPTAGVLQYSVFTYNGANVIGYLNGVQRVSTAQTTSLQTSLLPFRLGGDYNTTPEPLYTGKIDEVRISNVARATGWITTEFNNQGTPTTFYAVGSATVEATKVVFAQQPSNAAPGGYDQSIGNGTTTECY